MFFFILDAARLGFEIRTALALNPAYDSLYRGQSQELLATIAPYLFQNEPASGFDQWLQGNYGKSWGIGLVSEAPMDVVHKHFRKFLLVKTDDGKELYFRFYDPRVLRAFLPTCDANQLADFFGPIQQFLVEDPAQQRILIYELKNAQLLMHQQPVLSYSFV